MPFALTPTRETDLPEVVDLMNMAFRGLGPNAGWNSEGEFIDGDRTNLAALKKDIEENPDAFLLVVRENDQAPLQGCVWLKPVSAETWYLGLLSVNPHLQNSGLGRRILAAAEKWAADRGATLMEMKVVNIRDTLIAWYERRGYRLTGEVHPFPYGDTRFGIPRRNDLAFVVLQKSLTTP